MTEKQTEVLAQTYINDLLNINVNSTCNKSLFNSLIPDCWYLTEDKDKDYLLVGEFKKSNKKFDEGIEQLFNYCDTAYNNNNKLIIYCFLATGINKEEFQINYYRFNETNKRLRKTKEINITKYFKQRKNEGIY